jgi:lipopolysaccharide biosynthesis glycosyltransferase
MNKVLVSVANSEYIKYCLPLFQSSIEMGKWDGEFCLIVTEDTDPELTKRLELNGIHIFRAKLLPETPPIHFYKMYLFDEYFKKWDWVLYSDLDVLFLNPIKLNLTEKNREFLYTKLDGFSFMQHFLGSESGRSLSEEQIEEKTKILQKYGDGEAFQTCFILYHTDMINSEYLKKLYRAYIYYYCYYELTLPGVWDQTIFNIVFFEKWLDIGDGFVNRNPALDNNEWDLSKLETGYMDTNDYIDKIALHFFHYFPPWNENNLKFYPIWKEYYEKILLRQTLI